MAKLKPRKTDQFQPFRRKFRDFLAFRECLLGRIEDFGPGANTDFVDSFHGALVHFEWVLQGRISHRFEVAAEQTA